MGIHAARVSWGRQGSAHSRGYGAAWRKLREQVMRRDAGLCQPCKPQLTLATEVDHILPKAKGGTDDISNLQAICSECHRFKTDRDNGKVVKHTIGANGWPVDAPT